MASPVQCQNCGTRVVGVRTLMPLSDLQRIHRSGPYLPAPEMRKYHETLSDVQADITTLQTVIAELEAYASQIRTIVSPIRFVPNEILCLIFQAVCADATPETRMLPLILSSVCARWREVAVGTPHLWTFIYAAPRRQRLLCPDEEAPALELERDRIGEVIPLYLTRSRLMPVNIDVATQSAPLVRMLCSEAHRWTDVLFNMPAACLGEMYQSLDAKPLPNLTSLTLVDLTDANGLPSTAPAPSPLTVFAHTPKLHMLCLGGPVCDLANHPLPYGRISSLVLSWMSEPLGILRVIELCTSAYHVSVSDTFIECDDESTLPDVSTKAPFVSFRLGGLGRIQHVLEHITAPAMFSLKLAPADPSKPGPGAFELDGMIDFVRRSAASLRRLEIACVRVSDVGLLQLLAATPGLTELYVHQQPGKEGDAVITSEVVRRLTIPRAKGRRGRCWFRI
ncbi:hypothetical protein BDZ89DRAFT_983780 [Hymenopellis radicata]|nr:hypothetical protein BDZ89DRAFT_983780 [Hymenopellis radicata]